MKKCIDGKREHEHCEDIGEYVVCHDCKTTLGRKTEVYSRVCGYYRPTSNWNPGKQQEHYLRKPFVVGTPH